MLPATGPAVEQIREAVASLIGSLGYVGAMDNTFMAAQSGEPAWWCDAFYCYKTCIAVSVLGVVDSA